jgi:hypothetical protein
MKHARSIWLALVAATPFAAAACSGSVVDQGGATTSGAGGGASTATAEASASTAASTSASGGGLPDAGPDAVSVCDDPATCSRLQTRGGCIGAPAVGDFCDFLATACSAQPPDCAAIGATLGASASIGSCGGGLSLCVFDFAGYADAALLAKLCEARDAAGEPVDCIVD